jgi:hypothetical protein
VLSTISARDRRVCIEPLAPDVDFQRRVIIGREVRMIALDSIVIDADMDAGASVLIPDFLNVAEPVEMPLLGENRIRGRRLCRCGIGRSYC